MKKHFLILTLLLLLPLATTQAQVVYSRETITIVPAKEVEPEPVATEDKDDEKEEDKEEETKAPPPPRQEHAFSVEIRSGEAMNTEGLFLQQPFADSDGLVITYEPSKQVVITSANIYEPVDILFVSKDGTINQIISDIDLSTLEEENTSDKPARAMFYLKGGTSERLDIRPGDWVRHRLFTRKPEVHKAPTPPQ